LGAQTGRWVTTFLMLSIFGILNTQVMFAPRVIFSMSRDGLFFASAGQVNKHGSPTVATHMTVGLACLFLISSQSISDRLSDIATFFFVASYLAGFASLLQLRKSEPNLPLKLIFIGNFSAEFCKYSICGCFYLVELSDLPLQFIEARLK
jgi:APA family basic amino acid/polyamine antiporter